MSYSYGQLLPPLHPVLLHSSSFVRGLKHPLSRARGEYLVLWLTRGSLAAAGCCVSLLALFRGLLTRPHLKARKITNGFVFGWLKEVLEILCSKGDLGLAGFALQFI